MCIKSFNYIKRLFNNGNVCVTGLRGRGKDLIFGNVIIRQKKPYISNLDYGGDYFPFDYKNIDLGGNTYDTMLNNPLYYEFPYPLGSDVYISDVGVYFPSQYCNELNKKYQSIPYYMALSRQVSHNNVHVNVQNLNRAWDKLREQSDIYLMPIRCFYIPKVDIVIQHIIEYDKYDSCVQRVKPCRIKVPLIASQERILQAQMYVDNFENQHGIVKSYWVIYHNKSKHDTYYFQKILSKGVKNEKQNT